MQKKNVVVRYPKIMRIKDFRFIKNKKELSKKEKKIFFNNPNTIVEEKIDGKLCYLNPETNNNILMCEYTEKTHTLYYKNLPDNLICFDVFDPINRKYLFPEEKIIEILNSGSLPAPIVLKGKIGSLKELEKILYETTSSFNSEINPRMLQQIKKMGRFYDNFKNSIEGLVIKIYGPEHPSNYRAAKIIRPEFENIMLTVGRYENFPWYNVINFWTLEEYSNYLREKVLGPLNIKLSNREIENYYRKYAETWRKKRFYF